MPAAPVLKVIVTHRTAARAKYGAAGWSTIRRAVSTLIAADKSRGVTTRLLAVDAAADAKTVGATTVNGVADGQATKAFIDRIYSTWHPAYLLILGGPELLTAVNLANPLWDGTPNGDPDQFIASDLPYACSASFSASITAYQGPSRAVGRNPDLMGAADPSVLVGQLMSAARAKTASFAATTAVFALSTKTWQRSTQLSISKLPGVNGPIRTSPSDGPNWTKADLSPTLHFVNCHGGEFDPRWYGEARAGQQALPVSIDASLLGGLIANGTVVSAECCYSAAHWPPSAAGGQSSVALSYLQHGAAGVFGSATTAYGPASGNQYADVISRLFLEELLGGASLGRAALSARQRYIQSESFLDPTNLTTLAQFTLLGDPSAHPLAVAAPHARTAKPTTAVPAGVAGRRAVLEALGDALGQSTTTCSDTPRGRSGISRTRLAQLIGAQLPAQVSIRTFDSSTGARSLIDAPLPVAHIAFVPQGNRRSLIVVRMVSGSEPEVRTVVPR
jgi:hypothetical protein